MAGSDNPGTGDQAAVFSAANRCVRRCGNPQGRPRRHQDRRLRGRHDFPGWSSFHRRHADPQLVQDRARSRRRGWNRARRPLRGDGRQDHANGGYGVGTVFNTVIDTKARIYCIDITAFDGVTFWAKGPPRPPVNLTFVSARDQPAKRCHWWRRLRQGPRLLQSPVQDGPLPTDWKQYSVKFSDAAGGKYPVRECKPRRQRHREERHPRARVDLARCRLGFLARRDPVLQGHRSNRSRRRCRRRPVIDEPSSKRFRLLAG